jgi:hypothetical protein
MKFWIATLEDSLAMTLPPSPRGFESSRKRGGPSEILDCFVVEDSFSQRLGSDWIASSRTPRKDSDFRLREVSSLRESVAVHLKFWIASSLRFRNDSHWIDAPLGSDWIATSRTRSQ